MELKASRGLVFIVRSPNLILEGESHRIKTEYSESINFWKVYPKRDTTEKVGGEAALGWGGRPRTLGRPPLFGVGSW